MTTTPSEVDRRLVAILVADVVGYSALMAANEEQTIRHLKSLKSAVQAVVATARGRVVDMAGDGILAEFSSALGALSCAIAIQEAIAAYNRAVEPSQCMRFRIGINLGDVVYDETTIYGDGVNIAARLEAFAEPGGICVSGKVYEETQGKLDVFFDDIGPQILKNISHPVHAFRIHPGSRRETGNTGLRSSISIMLTDKPSVAVLPFDVIAGDAELEGFADGLTEDIITGLSHLQSLWVIARNTVFTYKRRAIDVRAVARELGVQYVIEGSVRKSGDRLRMTAQLVEGDTGHHIWALKLDRAGVDLFSLQDEFTTSVVASVQTQLILIDGKTKELSAKPETDVARLLARSWQRMYELTPEGLADSKTLAERAIAIDPTSGMAARLVSTAIWHQIYMGYIPMERVAIAQVNEYARLAIKFSNSDEYAYWACAFGHLLSFEHDQAVASLRRALQINPNCSLAFGTLGTVHAWSGQTEESIANNELAIRINPRDPSIFFRHFGLGLAHFLAARYSAALDQANLVVQMRPTWWLGQLLYAASLAKSGRVAEACRVIEDLRSVRPDFTIQSLAVLPFAQARDREHFSGALSAAGLPPA
jgi:adenylate cyclase